MFNFIGNKKLKPRKHERNNNMRWYDLEPDVCMAISMIECAQKPAQIDYAKFIINQIKEKDTDMNYIKNVTKTNLNSKYTRWYDTNETLSTAFAYLKATTKQLQKEVSLAVLAYINSTRLTMA